MKGPKGSRKEKELNENQIISEIKEKSREQQPDNSAFMKIYRPKGKIERSTLNQYICQRNP